MKKSQIFKTLMLVAATLGSVACLTACSSDDSLDNRQALEDSPKQATVIMTVEATKASGDNATNRALSLSDDGKTLYGKWEEGEEVWVYRQYEKDDWRTIGTLSPTNISADGLRCTLTGSFEASDIAWGGGLEVGDELKLELGDDISLYFAQNGSLQTISDHFDHNLAMVTVDQVNTVTDGDKTVYSVTTTGSATFEPQKAIVRFNFQDKLGRPISAWNVFSYELLEYDLNFSSRVTSVYMAVTAKTYSNISFRVTGYVDGKSITGQGDWYTYTRSNVTFEKGKFYDITLTLNRHVWLHSIESDFTAQDGDIFEKRLYGDHQIFIPDGATVTLQGASINDENSITNGNHAGITCLGDATIVINTTNKYDATSIVRSFGSGYPAIKPGGMGSTLTIKGNSGRLQAFGGDNATAIGGSSNLSCGNIVISGGTVEATGGTGAPAIGNYGINKCGTITIENTVSRVTATKGSGADCSIGRAGAFGSCGTVTIGGIVYWDGLAYQNGGEAYLATSPLTYQP